MFTSENMFLKVQGPRKHWRYTRRMSLKIRDFLTRKSLRKFDNSSYTQTYYALVRGLNVWNSVM